jgi:hypothetical protein
MGLPSRQRRILDRIECALRGTDPRFAALFSLFARLNAGEDMPRTRRSARPWLTRSSSAGSC